MASSTAFSWRCTEALSSPVRPLRPLGVARPAPLRRALVRGALRRGTVLPVGLTLGRAANLRPPRWNPLLIGPWRIPPLLGPEGIPIPFPKAGLTGQTL